MLLTTSLRGHSKLEDGLSEDIREMVNEKGHTCISVIVPTHRLGQERQGDRVEIQKAVIAAKGKAPAGSGEILRNLDELFFEIDYTHSKEGIGLFVSPTVKKFVKFPFPVTKKIVVDKFFHLGDLLYTENHIFNYYVLEISEKEIHLFRGVMDNLEEIEEGDFPKRITEEYEYNKPSQSNTSSGYARVKNPEKDKSLLRQTRLKKNFQEIDKALSKYLAARNTPLLICGPEKDISHYKSVTRHNKNIMGSLSKTDKDGPHEMARAAWFQIRSFVDKEKLKLVNELKEKMGGQSVIFGIEAVWKKVEEGEHLTLVVEKDYNVPAVVTRENKLVLQGQSEEQTQAWNVINAIMTMVLKKNGKVVIVEKDLLKDLKRIAVILH